jgi:hypothetical protein
MFGYDDDDRAPTHNELLRWEADARGEERPEDEWVLTNYDVWMKNPHYKGPPGPHPEDPEPSCEGHRCGPPPMEESWWGQADQDDDVPF